MANSANYFLLSDVHITFGNSATPTTRSYAFKKFEVVIKRGTVQVPARHGDGTLIEVATTTQRTLNVDYMADPSDATSFWSVCRAAIETQDAKVYFTGKLIASSATSATNQRMVGSFLVTELPFFGEGQAFMEASATFPVVDWSASNVTINGLT